MSSEHTPVVVISRDGQRALLVEEVRPDFAQLPNRDAYFLRAVTRLSPRGDAFLCRVCADGMAIRFNPQWAVDRVAATSEADAWQRLAVLALGEHLDHFAIPEDSTPQSLLFDALLWELLPAVDQRQPGTDDDALRYISAKVYWDRWFRRERTRLTPIDAARLALDVREMYLIAAAGEGIFWNQPAYGALEPTAKLLSEYRAGIVPGSERPPIIQAAASLDSGRFPGAAAFLKKAEGHLLREEPDYENAAKESVLAVESIAKAIVGERCATLDDCLKLLERRGRISAETRRLITSVYAFRSSKQGIAHAGAEPPHVSEGEARLVLGMCAAAVEYLGLTPDVEGS